MNAVIARLVAVACLAANANAQDFAPAEPAGPSASAAVLLDRGLPATGGLRFEAMTTSWLGVPGLVTRGVCAAFAIRSVRAAAGWSQTGEPGAGWMSAGFAVGAASEAGGVAVRAVARRDLEAGLASGARDAAEVGGGAWLRAAAGVRVWARAPGLVTAGAAPPLARSLAIGAAAERDGIGAWFEREAPARAADESGTQAAGVWLSLERTRVWVEGRSRPLRAGLGMTVAGISVRALGHPRLGDTVTLALSIPPPGTPP